MEVAIFHYPNLVCRHWLCKWHFGNGIDHKLKVFGLYQTAVADPIFKTILNRLKKLIYLPHDIITEYLTYLISELEKAGLCYENFSNYLINKMTPAYNKRCSYFEKILLSEEAFHSLTSNIAENFNKNLNQFLFSINKSNELNSILKRIHLYVSVDYREVERQLALKKSDYRPSELAIKRFTNAKKFTNLMSRLDYQKVNINLFKKINRLLDNFDG